MSDRPDWDDQFRETEGERNARLRYKRQLKYDKERRTITSPDPRDPDYTRVGMFVLHNCSRCKDGREPYRWSKCPSTHCERRQECASPNECCARESCI